MSDSCEEEGENEMATIQTTLDEIKRQIQTLATRLLLYSNSRVMLTN